MANGACLHKLPLLVPRSHHSTPSQLLSPIPFKMPSPIFLLPFICISFLHPASAVLPAFYIYARPSIPICLACSRYFARRSWGLMGNVGWLEASAYVLQIACRLLSWRHRTRLHSSQAGLSMASLLVHAWIRLRGLLSGSVSPVQKIDR